MASLDHIGAHKTKVSTEHGISSVQYHHTVVFEYNRNDHSLTLRSGGWETVTTKTRINQACNVFGLDVQVYQEDYEWFVQCGDKTYSFQNGMVLEVKNETANM